jgi:hypothetical protein
MSDLEITGEETAQLFHDIRIARAKRDSAERELTAAIRRWEELTGNRYICVPDKLVCRTLG